MLNQARQVLEQIKNANGPAQHLTFAIWGMIMAGMYAGMGPPLALVSVWFLASLAMVPVLLFCGKRPLEYLILADVALTAAVLTIYATHNPIHHPMYTQAHDIWDNSSHILGPVFMIIHGLYLANLVQRQRLERERLIGTLEIYEADDNAD